MKNTDQLLQYMLPGIPEAGCDEAGRGCLAGPVACAAVILPPDFVCPQINDSKKLTEKRRAMLRPIIEQNAFAWSVVFVSPEEIDKINILNASIIGMHRALDNLAIRPEHIIVDGNKFRPYKEIPYHTVVKGDGKYLAIAAASILAKTHRDELMERLDKDFPAYGWKKNKGYPTKEHRQALLSLGLTKHHRLSFGPCIQPSLPFLD
ncbi:MAG: ribonuclease HII [Prevotella sp.]|nr:ribonuclease HII [Bacteroides sp.]MCM1365756.1 ribonuclease HII [Prevotella sp.]MCM1436426.1 ribonuclease HII [Prevotella sp.]